MSLLVIPAADLDAVGRSIDADLPLSWLDRQLAECDVKGVEPGHLAARLSRSGTDVIVRGRLRAAVQMPCARCLEPARVDVDTELSLLLKAVPASAVQEPAEPRRTEANRPQPEGKAKGQAGAANKAAAPAKKKSAKEKDLQEYEFANEEADLDTYDGETVILDDFVREAILLEMPIFPLCSESCPGIRPASPEGGDAGDIQPIDPRLAPLGALRAALGKPTSDTQAGGGSSEARASADDDGAAPKAPPKKKTKKE
jgi:uncharacterized protein